MEELRSTDVLDKEIRADGVKKAEKILEKAEETAKNLEAGVEERVAKAEKDARKRLEDNLSLFENNVSAALPLEKQRYLVSFVHKSVIDGLNDYFETIGKEKRFSVIKTLVERTVGVLGKKQVNAVCVGFDVKKCEKMLEEVLGKNVLSCKEGQERLLEEEAVEGFKFKEGILLKAEDGSVSCRLTLDEKIKEILNEKSAELAAALFGGRLPE